MVRRSNAAHCPAPNSAAETAAMAGDERRDVGTSSIVVVRASRAEILPPLG
jgi:hypothetical protein